MSLRGGLGLVNSPPGFVDGLGARPGGAGARVAGGWA